MVKFNPKVKPNEENKENRKLGQVFESLFGEDNNRRRLNANQFLDDLIFHETDMEELRINKDDLVAIELKIHDILPKLKILKK